MDWEALVTSYPPLATIPLSLRSAAAIQKTVPHEILFHVGEPTHGIFCVVAGEVRLVRRARNGAEIVLQRSRGGFFAEVSLVDQTYHCDAVVTEPGLVLRFPAAAFHASLREDAAFRDAWAAHLAREVRKLRAQCERLSLRSAAERVLHYVESEGTAEGLTLQQSRKAWASELGLTHEALYRTLSRLESEGVLQIDGQHIKLQQP